MLVGCDENDVKVPQTIVEQLSTIHWMLSTDRTVEEQTWISSYIYRRWGFWNTMETIREEIKEFQKDREAKES